jgi:hypothetical protein
MNPRNALRIAGAFAAALMLCVPAQAQLFRAYVASDGNDANPCTLSQPCRLLPAAITAVAGGGEIWMLDSANYNTGQVNITKSVTILAVPGVVGSLVATGSGNAIYMGLAGLKVTLRNLVIVHLANSANGIELELGAELNVAECEIANVQGNAIYAHAPNSRVTVKNTVLRGSSYGFFASDTVTASLDGVQIKGTTNIGVVVSSSARVTVSNSVLTGNQHGASVTANVGFTSRLGIINSVVDGNAGDGIIVQTFGVAGGAELTLKNSMVSNNGTGIWTNQFTSSTVMAVLDDNAVTYNAVGIFIGDGPPTIYTRGNNTLKFNTSDVVGGVPTPLAGQ